MNLYFKRDFLDQKKFDHIHASLKYANRITYSSDIDMKSSFLIYFQRIRIICYYLANYYELIGGFEYFDQLKNKSTDDDVDDDDESIMDESNDIETDIQSKVTDNSIIKSAPYYWSMFKELTLHLFKNHALKIAIHAYKVNTNSQVSKI